MGNVFKNKTVLITGGSRGIGKAIAIKMATEGANVVIAAKTVEEHPKLEGTIYSAAKQISDAGNGEVLPVQLDVRDEQGIGRLVQQTVDRFGGIDILVNNASAISISRVEQTDAKRYDLMQDINVRGPFLLSQACIPFLKKSENPHILMLSPPINLDPKWFGGHLAYTISKYGMSMIVLGLSEELKQYKIAVNALWPQTTIATAAVQNLLGGDHIIKKSRKAGIVADAAFYIFQKNAFENTGQFFIDEAVLRGAGIVDFDQYAVEPGSNLLKDLFL